MRKKYFAKEDAKGEKRKAVFPVALILTAVCLTFVAYGRSLNGPLVLDDTHYLDPSKLEGSIGHFRFGVRFIPFVSFVLNYMLTGMNPVFFRITNIILHVISACLAFYLASLTMALPSMRDRFGEMPNGGASRSIPLAVCVLFLLHPIQTSAVNYITQRMAIMACMFSFAGFISYVKGGLSRGRKSLFLYGLSALFFVFAIFSKENAVMVLPMLPLYDLLFLSSFQWKEFKKRFIPLVLLFAALGVMVISHLGAAGFTAKIISVVSRPDQPLGNYGWTGIDIQWTPKEYVLTELRIVSRYIILLLFPNPSWLVFDHANAYPVSTGLLSPVSTFFSLLFLLSLLFLSVRYVKRVPLISFGILWYLVTITLESFIALGLDPYFEHRNYLPSFGAFLSLASLLGYADRLGVGARGSRVAGEGSRRVEGREVVLCIATVLLFLMTFARNGVWTTDDLLWRDTLRKSPQNPRALTSLSSICLQQQKFREAEDYIQRASKIPHMSHVFKTTMLINEASLYKETNRKQEAVAILKGLIAERGLSEADPSALYLMGEILREEGKPAEAKDYLTRANAKRRSPLVLISLGLVSRSLGETGDAEEYFTKAIKGAPDRFVPYVELGDIYFARGDTQGAERYYEKAMAIERNIPKEIAKKMFLNLAQVRMSRGELERAADLLKKAAEMDPLFYPPYIFLGDISMKKGDTDSALRYLEKALSLQEGFAKGDPNAKLVYFNLGMAHLAKGEKGLARRNLALFLSVAAGDGALKSQVGRAREKLAELHP